MNKQLNNSTNKIILIVLGWRIWLFIILIVFLQFLSLYSKNFLGGGFQNYNNNPYIFAFANFDGEHYLDIAQRGYVSLNHSFFPLYPLVLKVLSFGSIDLSILSILGNMVSLICFAFALLTLRKLISLDFSKEITAVTINLLILFPTSFYFAAVYTESLFLLLTVGSFYFMRKSNFLLASFLAGLSSVTRVTGIFLFPVLLLEWFYQKKSKKELFFITLAPLGLLFYMWYLYLTTGSPLAFYNELSTFGVQRQGNFIILPQVFYRYFKILITPNLNILTLWTTLVELFSAIMVIILLIYGFIKKIKISYLLYSLMAFLLPTFTGSFSSIPRYIIVLFPLFIAMSVFLTNKSKLIRLLIYFMLAIFLIIETGLFLRGYWVA